LCFDILSFFFVVKDVSYGWTTCVVYKLSLYLFLSNVKLQGIVEQLSSIDVKGERLHEYAPQWSRQLSVSSSNTAYCMYCSMSIWWKFFTNLSFVKDVSLNMGENLCVLCFSYRFSHKIHFCYTTNFVKIVDLKNHEYFMWIT